MPGATAGRPFVVHTVPGSPFSRSVMVALEEKGLPWTIRPIEPGGLKRPRHLALHPFGRMPVLEHGSFVLYETQAIIRYIDGFAPNDPLTPAGLEDRARMDQAIAINDWYLFPDCARIIAFQRIIGPMVLGIETDEAAIRAALPASHVVFAELARILGTRTWFGGGIFSLADILLAPQMSLLAQTPEWGELVAGQSNLIDWLGRSEERPSMISTSWERVRELAGSA